MKAHAQDYNRLSNSEKTKIVTEAHDIYTKIYSKVYPRYLDSDFEIPLFLQPHAKPDTVESVADQSLWAKAMFEKWNSKLFFLILYKFYLY